MKHRGQGQWKRPTPWWHCWLLVAGSIVGIFTLAAGDGEPTLVLHDFERPLMGTKFRIRVQGTDAVLAKQAAEAAFDEAAAVENAASDYRDDSDLRILLQKPGEWQPTAGHLRALLELSLTFAKNSEGAFDPTAAPLVTMWKRAARRLEWPEETRIDEARANTGWKKLHWDAATGRIKIPSGMYLDLGGIAKGYAADRMGDVLRARGFTRFVAAASGDILVGDAPEGKQGWDIELSPGGNTQPDAMERHMMAGGAVSTSGDAYQWWEWKGQRYSHIVDPVTGLPVKGGRAVTVFAPRAVESDALATALSVLGPERGATLLQKYPGSRAIFFVIKDDGTVERTEVPAVAPGSKEKASD